MHDLSITLPHANYIIQLIKLKDLIVDIRISKNIANTSVTRYEVSQCEPTSRLHLCYNYYTIK